MKSQVIFLFAFLLLMGSVSAAINVQGFFEGQMTEATINFGESIDFDAVIASDSYPITYDVVLRNPGGQIIHNYADNQNSNSFLVRTYTVVPSDYNEPGEHRIFISAEDNSGDVGYAMLILNINEQVNNAPTVTLTSPLNNAIDVPTTVQFIWNGEDADGDDISYILYLKKQTEPIWETYDTFLETYTVSDLNFNTIYNWKVSANDGTSTVVSSQRTFTTASQQGNIPPYINDISGYNPVESGVINFQADARDDDGQVIRVEFSVFEDEDDQVGYYTDTTPADGFSFSFNSESVEYNNLMYVRARAYDNSNTWGNFYIEGPFTVDNRQQNNAPTINLVYPSSNAQNIPSHLTLEWSSQDADGDELFRTVYLNEKRVDSCTNILSTACSLDLDTGLKYSWYVFVTDNEDSARSGTRTFTTFQVNEYNEVPTSQILSPYDSQWIEGIHTIRWSVDDFEDSSEQIFIRLEYSKRLFGLFNFNWHTIYEGQNVIDRINFNTESINNGAYSLRLTAIDAALASDSETVNFNVENLGQYDAPENRHAPMIVSGPNRFGRLNELYQYQLEVEDMDQNPAFVYSLLHSPHGMHIDGNGLVTWTPNAAGTFLINLRVYDGRYSDTQEYVLAVTDDYFDNPDDKVNEVHKFTLSNTFIRYDDKYIYIYPLIKNLGNQRESIMVRVFNMNNGDFKEESFSLDLAQGKFNYIMMDRPSSGHYTYKIEAVSSDYHDILYRTIDVI